MSVLTTRAICLKATVICTLGLAVTGFWGCRRSPTLRSKSETSERESLAELDVCSLISNDEIKQIIGEIPTSVTPSSSQSGGFEVSQCYFQLPTSSNSIVISVTRRGAGADSRSPKEIWEAKIEHREDEEEEERRGEPTVVSGLGDKAVWLGTTVGGVLYVLKGDSFVRVSVGSLSDPEKRIETTQAIAAAAVKRLP